MIESLDMNVLLEGNGRKLPEKPKLKTNTNLGFTQYEKPQAQETAPGEGIISTHKRSNYDDEFVKSFWSEFNKDEVGDYPLRQYEKETEKEPYKNEKYNNYITLKQAGGKIVSPNKSYGSRGERYANQDEEFMSRYNYADDYLMSGGKNAFESTVKGAMNRMSSASGVGIENLAYFLYDNIPENASGKAIQMLRNNAKEVLNKNTAGKKYEKADSQFEDAKETTNWFGDRIIDAADMASSLFSYATVFGPKNIALSQSIGGGLGEYRNQRENGADKSEAISRAVLDGTVSYLIERLGGIGSNKSTGAKVKISNVVTAVGQILKNASQEGWENVAEYTIDSFIDALAEKIYNGEASIDWDLEEAINSIVEGAIAGGSLAFSDKLNGRKLDIVEESDKIIKENSDKNIQVEKINDLNDLLGKDKLSKAELDKLLWYLNSPKVRAVNGITRDTWQHPIIMVENSLIKGAPNSITQRENKNGGIVRNYYDEFGKQNKQIANFNEDGNAGKQNKSEHLEEHAHDYKWVDDFLVDRPKRRLHLYEKKENSDIL